MSKTTWKLTKEAILQIVDQKDIFQRYTGIYPDRRRKYVSPFREDKKPGCNFYVGSGGILYFQDWAVGSYNCFDAVMAVYNCDFLDALKIIDSDFGLGLGSNRPNLKRIEKLSKRVVPIEPLEKKELNFKCTVSEFSETSLKYWEQFYISKEVLELFNVYEVVEIRKNGNFYKRASASNPIYGYFFDEDNAVKFYRPLTTLDDKWRGNLTKDQINGLKQLPEKGETLYITSSMKDVMTLYSLGYSAIAPQGEAYRFSDELIEDLKSRFSNIIVLYDSDKDGIKCAERLQERRGFPYKIIPRETLEDPKDISDYMKNQLKEGKNPLDVKAFLDSLPLN